MTNKNRCAKVLDIVGKRNVLTGSEFFWAFFIRKSRLYHIAGIGLPPLLGARFLLWKKVKI